MSMQSWNLKRILGSTWQALKNGRRIMIIERGIWSKLCSAWWSCDSEEVWVRGVGWSGGESCWWRWSCTTSNDSTSWSVPGGDFFYSVLNSKTISSTNIVLWPWRKALLLSIDEKEELRLRNMILSSTESEVQIKMIETFKQPIHMLQYRFV